MTSADQLSTIFGALADPTRRAILTQLASGETSVTELAKPLKVSLPAVTKHLKVLQARASSPRSVGCSGDHAASRQPRSRPPRIGSTSIEYSGRRVSIAWRLTCKGEGGKTNALISMLEKEIPCESNL